jgi:solute carrier family 25 (peroxisomal adenine nucleotide transporter), member 17
MASYALYFWCHSLFHQLFRERHADSHGKLSTVELFLATSIAGVLATIATNPLWFVNTRVALRKDGKSVFEVVKEIYREEGLGAFFKGVIPNIVLVVNPIINFMVYEYLKQ